MPIPIPSFPQIVFLALAAVAIGASILMITRNDAVHSALSLVVVLFQLAGMYVLLNAPFLAVLQVLVYAGAILVLFLFVIMLLQLREGPQLGNVHPIQRIVSWPLGLLIAIELVLIIVLAKGLVPPPMAAASTLPNPGAGWTAAGIGAFGGEPRALGRELYTSFLLPFEVASLILLVAVVGAIVLARREETWEHPVGLGISLGRQFLPGSPQSAEIARVLSREVPVVAQTGKGRVLDLEANDPQVPVVGGDPSTVDRRSPPSTEAYAGENKDLTRR